MNTNPEITLIVTTVAGFIGGIFSIFFTFFPKLNTWFAAQTSEFKQATMSISGLVISLIVVFVNNYGNEGVSLLLLATQVVLAWLSYINTNQSTDRAMPKPKAVKDAKANAIISAGAG